MTGLVPKRATVHNQNVEDVFPQGDIKMGEVGIEIEVEGENLLDRLPSYWSIHKENSLRGESKEYALTKPVSRKSVGPVLKYLSKKLETHGSKVYESQRTSVHVHLNCQGMAMRHVYNQICIYLILEDILMEFAGPTRVGNVFCLRAKDAEDFVDELVAAAKKDDFSRFAKEDTLRYTSINVCALFKFNSLEFRGLRGTMDILLIEDWINILLAIKDAARLYQEPREIIAEFSGIGPREWMKKVLGEHYQKFFRRPGLEDSLWESLRLIQEVAYAIDWEIPDKPIRKRVFHKNRAAHIEEEHEPLRRPRAVQGLAPRPMPMPHGNAGWVMHDDFEAMAPPPPQPRRG